MKKIKYNYEGTGIKTLRTTSTFVIIAGIISGMVFIVLAVNTEILALGAIGLIIIVGSFVIYGSCHALAFIAESTLYKTRLMEYQLEKEKITFEYEAPKLSYEPEDNAEEDTPEDNDFYK